MPSDEEEEYEVEYIQRAIVDRKRGGIRWKYFVKWKGYPSSDNTWEEPESFESSPGLLDTFWEHAKLGGRDPTQGAAFKVGEEIKLKPAYRGNESIFEIEVSTEEESGAESDDRQKNARKAPSRTSRSSARHEPPDKTASSSASAPRKRKKATAASSQHSDSDEDEDLPATRPSRTQKAAAPQRRTYSSSAKKRRRARSPSSSSDSETNVGSRRDRQRAAARQPKPQLEELKRRRVGGDSPKTSGEVQRSSSSPQSQTQGGKRGTPVTRRRVESEAEDDNDDEPAHTEQTQDPLDIIESPPSKVLERADEIAGPSSSQSDHDSLFSGPDDDDDDDEPDPLLHPKSPSLAPAHFYDPPEPQLEAGPSYSNVSPPVSPNIPTTTLRAGSLFSPQSSRASPPPRQSPEAGFGPGPGPGSAARKYSLPSHRERAANPRIKMLFQPAAPQRSAPVTAISTKAKIFTSHDGVRLGRKALKALTSEHPPQPQAQSSSEQPSAPVLAPTAASSSATATAAREHAAPSLPKVQTIKTSKGSLLTATRRKPVPQRPLNRRPSIPVPPPQQQRESSPPSPVEDFPAADYDMPMDDIQDVVHNAEPAAETGNGPEPDAPMEDAQDLVDSPKSIAQELLSLAGAPEDDEDLPDFEDDDDLFGAASNQVVQDDGEDLPDYEEDDAPAESGNTGQEASSSQPTATRLSRLFSFGVVSNLLSSAAGGAWRQSSIFGPSSTPPKSEPEAKETSSDNVEGASAGLPRVTFDLPLTIYVNVPVALKDVRPAKDDQTSLISKLLSSAPAGLPVKFFNESVLECMQTSGSSCRLSLGENATEEMKSTFNEFKNSLHAGKLAILQQTDRYYALCSSQNIYLCRKLGIHASLVGLMSNIVISHVKINDASRLLDITRTAQEFDPPKFE